MEGGGESDEKKKNNRDFNVEDDPDFDICNFSNRIIVNLIKMTTFRI